jgi:small conductance mechanosensitive channel
MPVEEVPVEMRLDQVAAWYQRLVELAPHPVLQKALEVALIVIAAWIGFIVLSRLMSWIGRLLTGRVTDEANRPRVAAFVLVLDTVVKGGVMFLGGLGVLTKLGLSAGMTAKIVGTLAVGWVVYVVLSRAIRLAAGAAEKRIESEPHRQRVKTLILLGESIVRYGVIIATGITVLGQLGFNLGPLLAGAGIAGLAAGFGAQNLVRDVISGFFIIMEGQYAVGDQVKVNGVFGRVERLGLRITAVRQPDGELRYFSNGSISSAENFTAKYVAHVVTVPLPAEDPGDAEKAVREILFDFDREFGVFRSRPQIGQTEDLETYARVVRVETHSIPGRQTLVEQKLSARMKAGLERAGYSLPAGTEVSIALRHPAPGAGS